jgi:hypothetical protein
LRRQWVMHLATIEELLAAIEGFYPASFGLWVAQQRGTLQVESQPGNGSVFSCEVMLAVCPPPADYAPVALGGARVLVVGQDALSRQLLAEPLAAMVSPYAAPPAPPTPPVPAAPPSPPRHDAPEGPCPSRRPPPGPAPDTIPADPESDAQPGQPQPTPQACPSASLPTPQACPSASLPTPAGAAAREACPQTARPPSRETACDPSAQACPASRGGLSPSER